MAFSGFEKKKIERAVAEYLEVHRPLVEIGPRIDIDVLVSGQSVRIVEICPHFRELSTIMESPLAKATYVKKSQRWKTYWMHSDLRWHSYTSEHGARSIENFFAIVSTD